MTEGDEHFRPLTELELSVFQKLLELDFAGCEQLKQQVSGLRAKQVDEDGSLQLQVQSFVQSQIKDGPAVEARYPDTNTDETNRAHVNVLLHTKAGKLWMLEIYKDDSSPVLKRPNPNEFELFSRFQHGLS